MKCATGLVVLGFICSSTVAAESSPHTLTFDERVEAQTAIEGVYWSHRIWPAENAAPRPPLATVMTQSAIRDKVTDALKKSNALASYWQRPITAEQLRAEVKRMAVNTRRPGTLRELFSALGNDPERIAECLARPILADRLVRSWYARDTRVHGELRQSAERALERATGIDSMPSLGGRYEEQTLELGVEANVPEPGVEGDGAARVVSAQDWDREIRLLAACFALDSGANDAEPELDTAVLVARLPLNRISPLQDDGDAFSAVAVLERGDGRIRIARILWQKLPFDEWWNGRSFDPVLDAGAAHGTEAPPAVAGDACLDDTWAPIQANAPKGSSRRAAVWTGSEMIVWGEGSGDRYDPSTDTWTPTSTGGNAPTTTWPSVVWTGTEMIVWGGVVDGSGPVNSGGRYNPLTNSWIRTTTTGNVPVARYLSTAVWTGHEMIVWGGTTGAGSYLSSGGRYDPINDSWRPTSNSSNVPSARYHHTAVWTGHTMIIWGGASVDPNSGITTRYQTGAQYDPASDEWTSTGLQSDVPAGRELHTAVWANDRMIVWGGEGVGLLNTGGRYDPITNGWAATSTLGNAPSARRNHTAVWTGREMIAWGGLDATALYTNSGGRYDPSTDSWTATNLVNSPAGRELHTAIWTGHEMIVWGGGNGQSTRLATGGRFDVSTNSWVPTNATGTVPVARWGNTAVWTGGEMIVWGGNPVEGNFNHLLNTGGRYDPATDAWTLTSLAANVPSARTFATAVWTGREMIIWGGYTPPGVNTGARYDPGTDRWTPTSLTGVPVGRWGHTAVWTGHEMVVWGGIASGHVNSGGRYNPTTDTWLATPTAGAPSARYAHTAIWTGREMIVWGGFGNTGWLASGSRYAPTSNLWLPMSSGAGLAARTEHTAVWTGREMIVWGGYAGGGVSLRSGGRYDPRNDAWTTFSAQFTRVSHSAVWTGSEMIVWGGRNSTSSPEQSSGAIYNPATGTWVATNLGPNTPTARKGHTAVWTGSEMLIWSGSPVTTMGASYCAASPCDVHVWYNDEDHDGFGDPADTVLACDEPYEYKPLSGDCDDGDASVHPGVPEICNGLDDDCDGTSDNGGEVLCDDDNVCTDDVCGGASGCVHTSNTSPCNDADACTTGDTCGGGTCNPGEPTNCDDGSCCTIDSCNPATGCVHVANTTAPVFTNQPSLGTCPTLWPPNHGYTDFTIGQTGATASSSCGIASIQFASCSSSQPENGSGTADGNTTRDCVYEPSTLHLRAERDGACSPIGRVYTTSLVAVDVCGNATTSNPMEVAVWHERGNPPTSTNVVQANGSNSNDTVIGTNGTYGSGCGNGSTCANGLGHDHSDADPEMEIAQQASIGVDDLHLGKSTDGSILLTWTEPTHEATVNVTRFHVYRLDPASLFWTQIAEVTKQTASYLVPSLIDGNNRHYKVTAVIK